jgi:UDP-glucose 4-epimerase
VFVSALTPDKGRDIRTLMRNLAMGENFCTFLEQAQCSHLTYVSSDAVYEDEANPVRENSCCNPSSFHGLMHLARERMLAYSAQKAKAPLLVLRPCALYGRGDTHNSYGPNRFARTAQAEGKITLFGNGEEKRDHLYIRDLSRLTARALLQRSEGVLNAASGQSISFGAVADLIRRLHTGPVTVVCQPRTTPVTHRHFDITALLQAFPDFRFTPLTEALSEAFGDGLGAG